MYLSTAREMIKRHEGLRLKPYRCTAGKLTIGYGRNLEDKGIRQSEAETMLENDINSTVMILSCSHNVPWAVLNDARKAAILDLAFNLGIGGLYKFKRMLSALRSQHYYRAAAELLDSRYATQVATRAKELATIIETGEIQ